MTPTKKDEGTLEQGQEFPKISVKRSIYYITKDGCTDLQCLFAKNRVGTNGGCVCVADIIEACKAHYRTEAIDEFLSEIEKNKRINCVPTEFGASGYEQVVVDLDDIKEIAERLKGGGNSANRL